MTNVKELPQKVKNLELRARHFKGTSYITFEQDAIEKAYLEQFKMNSDECVDMLVEIVSGDCYNHKPYRLRLFLEDMKKAKLTNFDDTLIRTIELRLYK